jgi:hypothetical protein
MRPHDQQRFAKLVSEFIDGCGIEPPLYLIAISSNGNIIAWASAWAPWLPTRDARKLAQHIADKPGIFEIDKVLRQRGWPVVTSVGTVITMQRIARHAGPVRRSAQAAWCGRPSQAVHPNSWDQSSGRPGLVSRDKARRLSLDRPSEGQARAAAHPERL